MYLEVTWEMSAIVRSLRWGGEQAICGSMAPHTVAVNNDPKAIREKSVKRSITPAVLIACLGVFLNACGDSEAELRKARVERCKAEGITDQALLDQCVQSPKKMYRQVFWHQGKSFSDEKNRQATDTYERMMGDLAEECRRYIKLN